MIELQICKRCVMDNKSDDTIIFDNNGFCNYCNKALEVKPKEYFPNEEGEKKLINLIKQLKLKGKNKDYDCVMGISGGLDSSYLAYLGSEKWGLRILAIHIDDGFDSNTTKENLDKLSSSLNLKIIYIKPDKMQYNELTRAYILAGVPNIAAPQDNILFAEIYKYMRKKNIKYFLSGGNFALESILQSGNTHDAYDVKNIKDINKNFGRTKINKLPFITPFEYDFNLFYRKMSTVRPLNYINYNRDTALKELEDFCGFQYYGSKHLENSLTKFIQIYWFYNKFGVDKRKSHLSSMIISNQLTREQALNILSYPLYDSSYFNELESLLKELNLSLEIIDKIMKMPNSSHSDYKTSKYKKGKTIFFQTLNRILRRK